MIEDKVTLARKRAELVASLAGLLPAEDRARIQGDLAVVNAQIKALNTTESARLKAAADRRKAAGMVEAQANAARARARLTGAEPTPAAEADDAADDDARQAAAVDAWIVAVLRRGGVKVQRAKDGALNLFDVPMKWALLFDALSAGLHAAVRGEALPEIATAEPKALKPPKARRRP